MAGIYIHIPFCEKKCNYCDFYSITNKDLINEFISSLQKEIEMFAQLFDTKTLTIDTIYFGGGTPSLLDPMDIEKIVNTLHKHFFISNVKEFTIECNPGTNFTSKLLDYKKIGINRLSIGVQSLDDAELKFLSRIHSKEEAITSIQSALAVFENVSVDIMFSLPFQKEETLVQTLAQLLKFDIKHISAYSLIYEEGTPLFVQLRKGKFQPKNEDEDFQLYQTIYTMLKENGFVHYEVSNFAKPGYESHHNLGYWRHQDYYGFGPSAHSFYLNTRKWNVRSIKDYIFLLKENKLPIEDYEILTRSSQITERIMLGLRAEGISIEQFFKDFEIDLSRFANTILGDWENAGLAIVRDGTVKLTSKGYFLCDKLTLDLLAAIETNYPFVFTKEQSSSLLQV